MEEKNENQEIFLITKRLIENLKYDEKIKNNLLDFNEKINNFLNYGYIIPNIFITNFNKNDLNIYKKEIIKLLNFYNNKENIIEFDKEFRINKVKKDNHTILIIDNLNSFIEEEKYSIDKYIDCICEESLSIVLFDEDSISNLSIKSNKDTIKLLNHIYTDLNIEITKEDYTKEEIYENTFNELNKRNINCELNREEYLFLINELLDSEVIMNSRCFYQIVDDITKYLIVNKKEGITKKDIKELFLVDVDKLKKVETKKENKNKCDINKMIGLKNIKKEMKLLENYLAFLKKCDKKLDKIYLNMFFLGNPGTGKTTVARKIKDLLFDLGYIKEDKIVEIIPTDLMGSFVGQTKNETRKILNKAEGGLLFIDEAYLLYTNAYKEGKNPFMEEAVVELIKYLEDPNHVVIFAGYPKEMKNIYSANPGIKSRIFKEIEFEDYSNEELYKILANNLKKINIQIDKNIKKEIIDIFNIARKNKSFGNARYCEQLCQKLITNHANRCLKEENYLIEKEDLPNLEIKQVNMGFSGGYNG